MEEGIFDGREGVRVESKASHDTVRPGRHAGKQRLRQVGDRNLRAGEGSRRDPTAQPATRGMCVWVVDPVDLWILSPGRAQFVRQDLIPAGVYGKISPVPSGIDGLSINPRVQHQQA